jgi:hypothetical protein
MLTDPVLGMFLRTSVVFSSNVAFSSTNTSSEEKMSAMGRAASYDRPSVADPARAPAVTTTRSVPNDPPELLQRMLLSDTHSLAAQAVTPTRDAPV